ncbi:MAG: DUF362 domain-containing protein [Smithella sp.]|nr:DUF362 domain-containing protein [Smithella sp.]
MKPWPAGKTLCRFSAETTGPVPVAFDAGDRVGIKLHWGERGNKGYLPPDYAREIVAWLRAGKIEPFIFDTTVLYSGGRRTAADSLKTAARCTGWPR